MHRARQRLRAALALEQRRQETEPVALSVINRLTWRDGPGDRLLAEDLLTGLRREPLTGRGVPVDLDMLSTVPEGNPQLSTGGYLDLHTGQVYDDSATDPITVGENPAIDGEGAGPLASTQPHRFAERLAGHGSLHRAAAR
jgi:hypothetical protein